MNRADALSPWLALFAGIATVFGFAPFGLALLPALTLAILFLSWQGAPSARNAALSGYAFGVGLFGAGSSWVYVALNTYGGMPAPIAGIGTAGFCAFLALYPALAGWLAVRWTTPYAASRAIAAAAAWVLTEWARSVVFTGFPWLSVGYAALPGSAPGVLAGYAPVGGVFLVSFATAAIAAAGAFVIDALARAQRRRASLAAASAALIVLAGVAAGRIEWTVPAGAATAVSLVQGNVAQDQKFDTALRDATFDLYVGLVEASRGRLVVLPESAFPVFEDEVPIPVLLRVRNAVAARNGDALVGMFTSDPPLAPGGEPRYYNSVMSTGVAAPQLYRKRHLVPFGETIPLEPVVGWFIRRVLAIPLASQARGVDHPPSFDVAGQRVAVNICYEDAFGSEIRPQAEDATLLVNVTNDAWYGRSLAAEQHNQIASMRALETGRPLLRATNTGITSAIDHRGREQARLPWFTRGILEVEVVGRSGVTPYVRLGDALAVVAALAVWAAAIGAGRRAAALRAGTRDAG